ncbi:hypothetical protein CBR_g51927 [Chara braunii]|uniref:isocitrate dehydrogenase (NADP(+)) n=1 Tax=Chara braunii TaxID=69332 RepID=A0A388M9D7_CHABU|nr:hypothetical protein CBR_g51927 [Chara braunii]|eukprot:GBG91125.1 hypothetical protein CBR_g51927 [Chara braunii]
MAVAAAAKVVSSRLCVPRPSRAPWLPITECACVRFSSLSYLSSAFKSGRSSSGPLSLKRSLSVEGGRRPVGNLPGLPNLWVRAASSISKGPDGTLKVPPDPVIPFIEGDGTGPDIWRAARNVFDEAVDKAYGGKRQLAWKEVLAGEKAFTRTGQWLPDETLQAFRDHLVGIKGPLTTPVGGGIRSLNVALRQELDLYVCLRPVRWYQGVPSPVKHPELVDVVIFRENTEDIYAGIEFERGTPSCYKFQQTLQSLFPERYKKVRFPESSAFGIKPVSEEGSKRLVRAAIKYALGNQRRSVTLVHKILTRPVTFDVIATLNLNGDYLSDAIAAQVGGIGIAPGGNINYQTGHAIFEATHGTAPKYAGQDRSSCPPCGTSKTQEIQQTDDSSGTKYGIDSTRHHRRSSRMPGPRGQRAFGWLQAFTDAVAAAEAQQAAAEAERQRLANEAAAEAQRTAETDEAARNRRNAASTESLIASEHQWTTILQGMIFVPTETQAEPTQAEAERSNLATVMLNVMRGVMWNNKLLQEHLHEERQQRQQYQQDLAAVTASSGTTMKPSSARHPQTDGQTERAHQTAQMMLRMLIRPDQKDWVDRLPDIEFAYNTSVHPAICVTPFELHHGGEKAWIFADLLLPQAADIDVPCSPASIRKYRDLLIKARANMPNAQIRMQQQANRRRLPCPFCEGDRVWVLSEEFALEQDVSRKLLSKWFGPWEVTSAVGDDPAGPSFVINIPPHLTVHGVFHASKLAIYTPPSADEFPGRRSQDPPSMDGH